MIANDLMTMAGKLSLLVALAFGACFIMLEKKRGPMGLALLAATIAICAGQVVRMDDGRSATQYAMAKVLRNY